MKQLLVLICLLALSHEADAQNWFRTAGPVEDTVFDMGLDSNGILYAITPLGVNRSIDGGAEWTRPFLFPVRATTGQMTVAPNGNIVVSTDFSIFVSQAADTFSMKAMSAGRMRQFATSKTGRIYGAHTNKLLFSDKNGTSWQSAISDGEFITNPVAVATSKGTLITHTQWLLYASVDSGISWKGYYGFDAAQVLKLLILENDLWVCVLRDMGLVYFNPVQEDWYQLKNPANPEQFYAADELSNGSLLVSSSAGIHLFKDTSQWVDVNAGFSRNDSGDYYPVSRFVEDRKRNVYYAATRGAGVWKSAAVLQGTNAQPSPRSFTVSPNPFAGRTTIHFTEATPSWSEIELRNILGAVVWKTREYSGGEITINPQLPPGNYLLVLRTSERTESQWVTIIE